jgi:hypothetical protein
VHVELILRSTDDLQIQSVANINGKLEYNNYALSVNLENKG